MYNWNILWLFICCFLHYLHRVVCSISAQVVDPTLIFSLRTDVARPIIIVRSERPEVVPSTVTSRGSELPIPFTAVCRTPEMSSSTKYILLFCHHLYHAKLHRTFHHFVILRHIFGHKDLMLWQKVIYFNSIRASAVRNYLAKTLSISAHPINCKKFHWRTDTPTDRQTNINGNITPPRFRKGVITLCQGYKDFPSEQITWKTELKCS